MAVKGKHFYTGSVTSCVPPGFNQEPSLFLIYINDLSIKSSPECTSSLMTPLPGPPQTPPNYKDDLRTLDQVLGKEVANVPSRRQMTSTDCHQEKEQDPHQLHPPQPNACESRLQCKVSKSKVDREPALGETSSQLLQKSTK